MVLKASKNMKRRFRYSYSIVDILYNYIAITKVFYCWRKKLRNIHDRHLLFKKGEDKFTKEFDAVDFARTQRKLKMLIHWLMDKSERFLSVYQKSNAISLSSESENQSDDPDYTKIPKMLASEQEKQDHVLAVNCFFVS